MVELSFFHELLADKWHALVIFQELYVEFWCLFSSEIFQHEILFLDSIWRAKDRFFKIQNKI